MPNKMRKNVISDQRAMVALYTSVCAFEQAGSFDGSFFMST